ncbi:MAG: hypothetical protein ACFE9Z_17180 [Promethearchaeota archaeon]
MNNYRKKLFIVSCLAFLFIIGFSTSVLAQFDPGDGGGGTLPPNPPALYQPTSPDNDGFILLEWSHVPGVLYKVFRLNPETQTYLWLATIEEETYTDVRPDGIWTYKVKSYDPNTGKNSLSSNLQSVVVELPIPQPLIGSTNRYFPQGEKVKLGYTFYYIGEETAEVQFKISEIGFDGFVRINLYIDPIFVDQASFWTKYIDINTDYTSEVIEIPNFSLGTTHTVILEIENSGSSTYILDYLELYNCYYTDSINYRDQTIDLYNDDIGNDYYSPTQIYILGEEYNDLMVMFGSDVPFDNKDLLDEGPGVNEYSFHPSLSLQMAHEYEVEWHSTTQDYYEYYYFDLFNIQMKVLNSEGDCLQEFHGGDTYKPELVKDMYIEIDDEDNGEKDDTIEHIYDIFELIVTLSLALAPWYVTIPIDIYFFLLSLIDVGGGGTVPLITKDFINDEKTAYEISWLSGDDNGIPIGGKSGPLHNGRTDSRFQGDWDIGIYSNGQYQIQYNWNIVVKRAYFKFTNVMPMRLETGDLPEYEFSLSGEYFINFQKE